MIDTFRSLAAHCPTWAAAAALVASACSSPPSSSSPSSPPLASTSVEHEHYRVQASLGCLEGGCVVTATVSPKAPYHVNAEYPHRLVVEGGAISDERATVAPELLRVEAKVPSSLSSLRLFMSVCSDEKCLIEKVPLSLSPPPPSS